MATPTTADSTEIQKLAIATLKGLAMDGPHRARSGHQGTAMALAPLAHVLFSRVMRYDADDPAWPDRDRFVLSGGHVSILLYSMLHLTGQGLKKSDLEQFRQWESMTPGHPEVGHTRGVEVTTGPLGQGFGNAVGMAIAERSLRGRFGSELVDHHTWVTAGDGDLSEGLSHEAASLAGHLGLGRLVVIYDDNHITIDGETELALSDNPTDRFESYGWHVDDVGEIAEDVDALEATLLRAKAETNRPSLIRLRSHIGYPSPSLTDSHEAHGLAFGAEEIAETKAVLGIPTDVEFWIPEEVTQYYRDAGRRGAADRSAWQQRLEASGRKAEWDTTWTPYRSAAAAKLLPTFAAGESIATRKASQACVTAIAPVVPALIGGSADLTGNTGTNIDDEVQQRSNPAGRQIYFGVREHAMGSAAVGAAHHGGALPVVGTFLVFADYMRPAVRLAALSKAKCVFVWTHDSVGVGEDGPTHQPVEQLMSLRAIPGLTVIRPADANETAGAWATALDHDGPVALILSRQNLPVLETSNAGAVSSGAYVLNDVADPDVTLVATGSEVSVCVEAMSQLAERQIVARVVSMPSWELFESLPPAIRHSVLDPQIPTVSIEAGVTLGWERYADVTIGIDRFGASAPGSEVLERLGINVDNVVTQTTNLLSQIEML